MPSSIRRIDVAGRDVTEYMQLLLRKSGHVFHTSAEKEVVRMIKEKTGYVASDPKKEEKEWSSNVSRTDHKAVDYVLPDGNKIKVRLLVRSWNGPADKMRRWDLNDSELLKYCSIQKSSDSNILVYIRLWLTPSIGPIWTFESHCLGT